MTIADKEFTGPWDIWPENATGQELGHAANLWDLFTREVTFNAATGANVITVPDNLASAVELVDAGGIEYMRVDSQNAQPQVHWNFAGANIDYRWDSDVGTHALFIQGSDGFVGIHIAIPLAELHVVGRAIIGDAGPINGSDYDLALNEYFTFWAVDDNESYMTHNLYFDAGVWKHRENGFASRMNFGAGYDIRTYATGLQDANAVQTGRIQLESGGDFVIYTHDTYWKGDGSGLIYGSFYGNEIAWAQAAAVQNTWYEIIDANITTGQLNDVTHDGNGELTVGKEGRYAIVWSMTYEADVDDDHIEGGIYGNGAAANDGRSAAQEDVGDMACLAGTAILDLAAASTIALCIRTRDANTPTITVEYVNIKVDQIGGT